ncbi:hypothetical protein [uncultured Bilophila sp.]|uniref:DUF1281 family ferredoxin-like fold protein n=1 Tax=uncultured Bilophila sp. TaxID=529385 RepID=UPI0026705C80|nr:hypothetical protein [uncultured Bilophila sp.]
MTSRWAANRTNNSFRRLDKMPNWVYNVLGAHDEQGRQFIFDNCINDKKRFTFNKMIPMPQILSRGCSPVRICNNFDEFKGKYGENIDYTFEKDGMLICGYDSVMSQKCAENLVKKYGADNWYDWSLNNWGCKWNANSEPVEDGDYEFRFETPWGEPEGFIKKFALEAYKKCPDSTFTWWWEEEQGYGQELFIKLGEIIVTKNWDMPYFDEHDIRIQLISGDERNIEVTKVTGGYPERYGNGGWYADGDESYYYETPLQALGNAVSQEIVRIDNIDELCKCLQETSAESPFEGVENKFSEKLKKVIQEKMA